MSTYDTIVDNSTINVHMGDPLNRATDEPDMKSKSSPNMYLLYTNCPLELKEILKPITVPEQEANRPKCLDGTRVDLLQRIREWASSSDSPNIFLLTGIAGTGKSTVARTVAEEFKRKKKLGCYIFFERGKTDSSTTTSTVIRTIAYHLARNNPVVTKFIWEATAKAEWSSFPSTNILFQESLYDPLLKAVQSGASTASISSQGRMTVQ